MARFGISLSCYSSTKHDPFAEVALHVVKRHLTWQILVLCLVSMSAAQAPPQGIVPFSTQLTGPYDSVDIATGGITFQVPVGSKIGKIPVSLKLVGNQNISVYSPNPQVHEWEIWSPEFLPQLYAADLGIRLVLSPYNENLGPCNGKADSYDQVSGITDNTGTFHPFPNLVIQDILGCTHGTVSTADGSGYTVVFQKGVLSWTAYDRYGNASGGYTVNDPDGATVSWAIGTGNSATDSLGTTLFTFTAWDGEEGSTDTQMQYSDAAGNPRTFQVNYSSYTLATNFGCPYTKDRTPATGSLPSNIALPDGSSINIYYEPTPGPGYSGDVTGRVSEITFPQGGYVAYTYSGGNSGLDCTSEVVPTLTRTLADGNGNLSTWTYVNSNNGSTGSTQNFTVTETDPAGNQTVFTFSGELQTQTAYYQGSATGTPLKLVTTCYNANFTSCPTWLPPYGPYQVTQTDVYTSFNGSAPNLVETTFDSAGNTTAVKKYDFGAASPPSGNPLSETITAYGTWNGNSCAAMTTLNSSIGAYMLGYPCTVTTTGPSGTASQTRYTYNSGGHIIQTQNWVSSSNWLTTSMQYGGNGASPGVLSQITDANTTTKTVFQSFACNGMLPSTWSTSGAGVSLSGSDVWDCNGGVRTSVTDPNQQTTMTNYTNGSTGDPFYRPLSVVAPYTATATTTTNYGYSSPTTFESVMNFNGTVSTTDLLTTTDGLGRTAFQQKRQGQGSSQPFDTSQTTYGWQSATGTCITQGSFATGACTTRSVPYTGTAAQPAPRGTAVTTTKYDALGRPVTITDGGGGTVSYTYSNNDVFQATSGSQTFQKQFEYDGLGRLTSVCEITAGTQSWPGGTCAQTASKTGYFTKYTYNALGELASVTENAQGTAQEVRNYYYDGLGRMIKEINPETGTTTYAYDSDPSGNCSASSAGDLINRTDNAGNVTCFSYDGLHRKLTASYPKGPNASATANKYFVYDSTSFTCSNGANVEGRLAEAYTGSSSSKTTDFGFCYSVRGEVTDLYETTAHSNGTYHTTASYFANGALMSLGGVQAHSGWTFNVEGEGRPWTVTDQTGPTNLVTNTTYYPSTLTPQISLGSGDSDSYTIDQNTGRTSGYQYNIGANPKYVTGTLGWNSNGTLGTLEITDAFDSANAQNCSYTYDDLSRLASVSCGTNTWQQNFSYDPFGNISKSGTSSFSPTYTGSSSAPLTTPTNQYYQIPGGGAGASNYYDLDGNLTTDLTYNYSWDSDGCATNVGGLGLTCDAFDRIVEENNSGTYKEVLYSPIGKLAIMSKQSASNIFVPLPGGEQATYTGSTIRFRHYDWQGSARFESNMSEQEYGDLAYAPFGESYAIKNTPYLSFTGQQPDTVSGIYDFPYREYNSTQGRWISPDPSGLKAADLTNPQSWNRYTYVLNNPLSFEDPTGLDCVYLNDAGTDYESIDQSSNRNECGANGGYWVDGGLVSYTIDAERGVVNLWGTTLPGLDLAGNTFMTYHDTILNVGWFQNTGWNPFGHIAIAVGDTPLFGLNPASDWRFIGSIVGHSVTCAFTQGCNASSVWSNTNVPGAVLPENPNQPPLQSVSIPITGLQANMIQGAINTSTISPPNYSVLAPLPACDCGSWAQQMMQAGGLQSGPYTWNPAVLIEQLNQIYYREP